jgi:undecaprenyl diphosphate synthase
MKESLKKKLDYKKIPRHVALIMDGNGRWAKKQGFLSRIFGHHNAIKAVRNTVEAAAELNVKYLTLFTFSTENWDRPQEEVTGLMELLVKSIEKETPVLQKNNIRLQAIGDLSRLPVTVAARLQTCISETRNNTRMTLVLALSYSSRWEILNATKQISAQVAKGELKPEDINETLFSNCLTTAQLPDPDLLIRTSGEQRISNFMLWQLAYTELYFTDVLFPDFDQDDFLKAILSYQSRERRFGKTGEQVAVN